MTNREPGRELDRPGDRESDERHDRPELPTLAEERRLEDPVRVLERLVVPVEPAARLCGRDEQSEQHRAKERVVLARLRPGVGAREDRGRGLPRELLEGERASSRVRRTRFALFDERAHERA